MARDCDELWDFNDPAATEARFRAQLNDTESCEAAYRAELLTQIARCQGLQRSFDAAHATLDEAAMLLDPGMVAEVRYLLERGRVINTAGERDAARPLFLNAWECATRIGEDFHTIDAAHMLAIVAPPEEAAEWHARALDVAERSGEQRARAWRGSLHNNVGWAHHDAGRYADVLAAFERALDARREHGQDGPIPVARWCIGRALRSLGRFDEALALQTALHAENAARGTEDSYVSEELGECLLALGRLAEAAPRFARAHTLLSADSWLAAHDSARLERLADQRHRAQSFPSNPKVNPTSS
jgi:tetratricopeptide (TPR) repeat protein